MVYLCGACGAKESMFLLRCRACGAWRTLRRLITTVPPVPLLEVSPEPEQRQRCNIASLDEFLGGGLVPGSVVLLAGPPGAGKSTIVLALLAAAARCALYATGEESLREVRRRAERIGARLPGLLVTEETDVALLLLQARSAGVSLLAVDSLQTVRVGEGGAAPGSPTQMRSAVALLRAGARECDFTLLLIGQVTKGGAMAGPRSVEHAVDVVLSVECEAGEGRMLRAVKNRFGSVDRVCRFALGDAGVMFDAR